MKYKKLIFFLEGLKKDEKTMRACTKKLKNTIGYSEPELFNLYNYLRKYPEQFSAKNFDEEKIFTKIMPADTPFNGQQMRQMATNLTEHIESFLLLLELNKSPYLKNKLLAEGVNALKMDDLYFKLTFSNIEKTLPKDEADKHLAKAQLYNDLYFHPKAPLHNAKVYRKHLDEAMQNLDIYYAIKKLKYSCEIISRKVVYGEELKGASNIKLKEFLDFLPETDNILVKLLSETALFFLTPNLAKYRRLKSLFVKHLEELHSEKLVILQALFNAMFVLGDPGGRTPEYFKLCKLGVDKGLFIKDGYISSDNFNNIVHISCQSKEFKWANEFIDEYVGYLDSTLDLPGNIRILYACYVLSGQGQHEKVISALSEINYDDFSYGLRKSILELKSIYEIQKQDAYADIADRTESFMAYLRRKHKQKYISTELRDQAKNFVHMLSKIAEFPYKSYPKENLKSILDGYKGNVAEQKWLEEKIKKL